MILSAYYRQNNYHPLYYFRGMLGRLFQIPFFIAAYHFLSELALLQGSCFLFLNNLGKPDALLNLYRLSSERIKPFFSFSFSKGECDQLTFSFFRYSAHSSYS